MARPRGFGGRGHGGARRLTQWIGPALQGYVAVADTGATLIGSLPLDEASTIVRVRGNVGILASSVAADDTIVGAFGMAIVSSEAFNAGVGSIPEPFTDADWGGWMVWRSFSYRFEFFDGTGSNFPNWSFEVDSKAMRKGGPNERLVLIAESQDGAYQISTPLRTLVKLS